MMDTRVVLILGTLAMLILAAAIVIFVLIYQRKMIKKNERIREIQVALADSENEMLQAILEGQEVERQRIALELHDSLGAMLSSLKMYADAIRTPSIETDESHLDKLSEITAQANEETRRISRSLKRRSADFQGFESALSKMIDTINKVDLIRITASGLRHVRLSVFAEMELFRIVQELINNTLKHAHASMASVAFSETEGKLLIDYRDDGRGFDANSVTEGLGSRGVVDRLKQLGATYSIDTAPGRGVHYTFGIPTDEPDQSFIGR